MRRAQALAGIALAPIVALSGCGSGASSLTATKGSPLHPTAFGCQIYPADDVERAVAALAACGSTILRITVNTSDFRYFDSVFAAAAKHGMRVLAVSDYAPQPVDVTAYAADAAKFQQRYAAYDPIWELWNEPNLAHYWGAPPDRVAYARLAIATGTALRNAGAREILSGGTSGIDVTWIYDLRTRGVFDVVTGCAVHSYNDPAQALNDYIQAVSLLPAGVKIYTTETCVDTSRGQASFFQSMWYLHRTLSLPMMVWCEFRDGTAGTTPPYTDPLGLVTADYTVKEVYRTAQALVTNA